ncbi:MAG: TonB-dependent receptor, partial [Chromatiales bacterium]
PSAYRYDRVDNRSGETVRRVTRPEGPTALNGRVAALWSPTPEQVVKLIWGSASQDGADADFAELERIETLELSTTLTRSRWMLSASLFQNDISSIARTIQVLDPQTGDYESFDDNSGRWRTRGVELILDARPLPELNLSGSLTWQQTEDRRGPVDPGYSPALLAKLKADWRRGPMTYAVFAHYVDEMDADWDFVTGPDQGVTARIGESVPGYWGLGLNLRWDPAGPGPYADLNVSNLLDVEIRYPANELTDFERGLIGPGRTVALTAGYAF